MAGNFDNIRFTCSRCPGQAAELSSLCSQLPAPVKGGMMEYRNTACPPLRGQAGWGEYLHDMFTVFIERRTARRGELITVID